MRKILENGARLTPIWRHKSLVAYGADGAVEAVQLECSAALVEAAEDHVFLGLDAEGFGHFALDLPAGTDETLPPLAEHGVFEDLRKVGPVMAEDAGAILAYARGIVHWARRHRFCGVCGAPTAPSKGGHERRCTDPACGTVHFPRTDPAVIMLIHDGGDRVILGRQPIWPPGQHSVLAGFVEPGESLEDAVAREVMEEVGVAVRDIRYHSSQPWPFPGSIMLGFTGRADFGDLTVDETEIESAGWFSRAEVEACPEDERFRLPRRDSIARRLIEDWLAGA